jgi:SAM-dependent methyltransferase
MRTTDSASSRSRTVSRSRSRGAAAEKGRGRARRKPLPNRAERAELHRLYEESVQCPEADTEFFARIYRELRGREPRILREDFCGTAKLALTWCLSDPKRRAYGVDLDGPTLEWARTHNVEPNARRLRGRLELRQADVRALQDFRADITCANNFSFCVFKDRAVFKRYLKRAHQGLKRDGLLFLELFGGTEAIQVIEEERPYDKFTYVWDQHSFNPMTAETVCHIHYAFPDGSRIDRAFTYDWRLWTVPELRDLLHEVGFRDVRLYWETLEDDPDDDDMLRGSGEYEDVTEIPVEQQESWLLYVVGVC